MMDSKLVGWFEGRSATPAFDPGMGVHCPICTQPLRAAPVCTVSLAPVGGDRSYFFRAHRACWDGLSPEAQSAIESEIADAAVERMKLEGVCSDHPAPADDRTTPLCAECGETMTPQNARIHPEFFLHDACLPDELRPAPAPPASPDARRLAAAGAAVELFQCGWLLMRGGAESIDAVIALIERHNARHFPAAIDYAAAREKVANVLRGYRPGPPHEVEDFYCEAAALLRKIGVKP